MIGETVEIEILECGSSYVKLGIRAPKEVIVLRKEIHITGRQNRLAIQDVSAGEISRLLKTLR